ncbi:MAG: hypothetical protein GY945_14485 [Rhodobacteraceae bacterium]|nr:hypothetical protein [Paracoccaceae bacterium]
MRGILRAAFVASTVGLTGLAVPAQAQEGAWSLCEGPGWNAQFGYDSILATVADMAKYGQGDGVSCRPMGNDFENAQTHVCNLFLNQNGKKWGVSKAGTGELTPLNCG